MSDKTFNTIACSIPFLILNILFLVFYIVLGVLAFIGVLIDLILFLFTLGQAKFIVIKGFKEAFKSTWEI